MDDEKKETKVVFELTAEDVKEIYLGGSHQIPGNKKFQKLLDKNSIVLMFGHIVVGEIINHNGKTGLDIKKIQKFGCAKIPSDVSKTICDAIHKHEINLLKAKKAREAKKGFGDTNPDARWK